MKNADLRSFQDMIDTERVARIRRISDEQGKTAVRVLDEWDTMTEILKNDDTPQKDRGHIPTIARKIPRDYKGEDGKRNTELAVRVTKVLAARLKLVAKEWNISDKGLWLFAFYELLHRYGWLADGLDVLRPVDRKALLRDKRSCRPLTHKRFSSPKRKRKRGAKDTAGADAEGSSGVHDTSVSIFESDELPWDD